MKCVRSTEINTEVYQMGDIISFKLKTGESMEAMAVKKEENGMIFCSIDCLEKEYPLQKNGDYSDGYEKSDLRKKLRSIVKDFPSDLVESMVPFDNGDYLRIPTEKEIFGKNEYGVPEDDTVEQFEPMKQRRNRIAFQGLNGTWEWYWLQNRSVNSAGGACLVIDPGHASYYSASNSLGVRPLFKIKNQ